MVIPRVSLNRWLLILLLGLGGLLRLVDSTDPPLDFHPTRQLRNAIVARGIYYEMLPQADPEQRALAVSIARVPARYEPPIVETLSAWTYLLIGGESIVVPRLYGTLAWLLAGLALYDLARRITRSSVAALLSLAYFLVLPFAVQASRSFQPDPLMTASAVIGVYFLYRWSEAREQERSQVEDWPGRGSGASWRFAGLAGVWIGFAALVKIFIAWVVGGAAGAMVLFTLGRNAWRSRQVWGMLVLMIVPAFLHYFVLNPGRSSEYVVNWSLEMLHLLLSTDFYMKWLAFLDSLFGQTFLFLSLIGTLLAAPRGRAMLIGLWIGYGLYGLSVPFQMYTHSYYHLQLTPIVALGLSPLIEVVARRASEEKRVWQVMLVGVILAGVGFQAWVARSILLSEDFRHEPLYWQKVGQAIPSRAQVIALSQDFGYRLMYYGWRRVTLWPAFSGLAELRGNRRQTEQMFAELAGDKDYFLVTALNQLEKQPELKAILEQYEVAVQGEGFVLYDLRRPKP